MSFLRNLVFVAVSVLLSAGSAKASLIINIVQSTPSTLLMTYSGSINMSSLGGPVATNYNHGTTFVSSIQGFLNVGSLVDLYNTGATTPPTTFGSGGQVFPTMITPGSNAFAADFVNKTLSVPAGYVSESPISGSASFAGTFATNGFKTGTYMYSWMRNGLSESVTLNIGPTGIPEPGSMAVLAIGSIASGFAYRRRRKVAAANA
ncbi:MAG: hypothetical protein RI963_3672 [Planctomycetota bacterium]|jgi:hypothetical protein